MNASTIEEISKLVNSKMEEIITKISDPQPREILVSMYGDIKYIENILMTQSQLTNEKDQENMNLKKEIELLKSNLEFAMGKDISNNQEILEQQAEQEMEPEEKANETEEVAYLHSTIFKRIDANRQELRIAIPDHEISKNIERICDEVAGMTKSIDSLRETMDKKIAENDKLKEEINKLQISLNVAMGKTDQISTLQEEAAVEMNTELVGRKFM